MNLNPVKNYSHYTTRAPPLKRLVAIFLWRLQQDDVPLYKRGGERYQLEVVYRRRRSQMRKLKNSVNRAFMQIKVSGFTHVYYVFVVVPKSRAYRIRTKPKKEKVTENATFYISEDYQPFLSHLKPRFSPPSIVIGSSSSRPMLCLYYI